MEPAHRLELQKREARAASVARVCIIGVRCGLDTAGKSIDISRSFSVDFGLHADIQLEYSKPTHRSINCKFRWRAALGNASLSLFVKHEPPQPWRTMLLWSARTKRSWESCRPPL